MQKRKIISFFTMSLFLLTIGIISDGWWYQNFFHRSDEGFSYPPDFKIIAHRGASADAPENTLSAFRLAIAQQADMIELDVHCTTDSIPVVIHDALLERTTNGRGPVFTHKLSDLKQLDAGSWFNPTFEGEKIPTLGEVLDEVNGDAILLIELKNQHNGIPYPKLLPAALQVIAEKKAENWCHLMSFEDHYLEQFARQAPPLKFGKLLIGTWPNLGFLFDGKFRFTVPYPESVWAVNPYYLMLTPTKIKHLHQQGHQIFPFTINEPKKIRQMAEMGADGVITDKPGEAKQLTIGTL